MTEQEIIIRTPGYFKVSPSEEFYSLFVPSDVFSFSKYNFLALS